MAELFPLNESAWAEWVATRPQVIKDMCAVVQPNKLYRMKSTGQRVTVIAFSEDRTVRVLVTGQFNCVVFDREVFGVAIDDLEECDLPAPDEVLGTLTELL